MRQFVLFVSLVGLSACTGACGPKPTHTMSSSECVEWKCPPGRNECVCVKKQ